MSMNYQKHLDRMAARIEATLLPDTCTIETVNPDPTVSASGVLMQEPVTVSYNGSTAIPCRLDSSRSFRPEKLPNQEINANEYVLHLPRSVFPRPNDRITTVVNGRTYAFEVRKLTALSEWRVTNEALIVMLEGQHD